MSVYAPERPQSDNNYDDNSPSWYKGSGSDDPKGDDLEAAYNSPSAEYPDGHPSKKKRSLDGDDLKNAEAGTGGSGSSGSPLGGELDKVGGGGGSSFVSGKALGAALNTTPMGRVARMALVMKQRKGQTAGITGLVVTLVIGGFAFFGAGLEAIHIKENFSNLGNVSENYSLKYRNSRSVPRILRAFTNEAAGREIRAAAALSDVKLVNSAKVVGRLEKAGFSVVKGEDGTITSISKTLKDGRLSVLDYTAADFKSQVKKFLSGGTEIYEGVEKSFSSRAGRWIGPNGRSLVRNRLSSSLESFVNKIKRDPTKPESENLRNTAIAAETPDNVTTSGTGGGGGQTAADPETGKPLDPETGAPVESVTDLDGPLKEAGEIDPDVSKKLINELDSVNVGGLGAEAANDSLAKIVASSGITTSVVKSLNLTGWMSMGCTAIGTIQYIASVRNVLFTIELARFATRYLNTADSQKGGLVVTEGLGMYLNFMQKGDGAYTSAPGLLYAMGDKSHKVSETSRTQFSGGNENAGSFGKLSYALEKNLPGFDTAARKTTCKIANNGWFQLGSTVVSLGIAAITFGAGAAVSVSTTAILGGIAQGVLMLAMAIGGPMLAQAGKHLIVADLKTSLLKGDALGAGMGALRSMNGNTNSLLIAPKGVAAALRTAALYDYKQEMKSESIFDRYFSLTNGKSLLAQVAFSGPSKVQNLANGSYFASNNLLNPATAAANIGKLGSGTAYAATNNQCTDPELQKYSTDPFCFSENSVAPDLDIDQTYDLLLANGHITADGQPLSDKYKKFIERCVSGQPTVVYNTNVKMDGSDETVIKDCTNNDVSLEGETTPASQAYAYIYDNQPSPSFFAKLFGQKAYAEPQDASLVSDRERFAAWNGFMVDKSNFIDSFTDAETPPDDTGNTANNKVMVIGDSLTVGMKTLGPELTANGWSSTINAQGCRGVYQPGGPIQGVPPSCPSGTIVDGLSVVSDSTNFQAIKDSGTIIIALGSNGTETSVVEFKDKATELIGKIRQLNDKAVINWLNVRYKTNGTKQNEYNAAIAELVGEQRIRLMDWNSYVTQVGADTDTANNVTWPANDTVHHDTNGYNKKVEYIIDTLGPAPAAGNTPTTIIAGDTTNIPCGAGTDQGVADGYKDGQLVKIRLCLITGNIKVNSQISKGVFDMLNAAKASGLNIGASDSFRTMEQQRSSFHNRCGANYPETTPYKKPPCTGAPIARPGYSNHQMGFALDLTCNGSGIPQGYTSAKNNACFIWMLANAAQYGLHEFGNGKPTSRASSGYEGWHWSVDGN